MNSWCQLWQVGKVWWEWYVFQRMKIVQICLLNEWILVKYSSYNFFWKDSTNFWHRKMTMKVRILKCLRRLFIILLSLTMTWFSETTLFSTKCTHGFMSNLIKKSWTDSTFFVGKLEMPLFSKTKHNSSTDCNSLVNTIYQICLWSVAL